MERLLLQGPQGLQGVPLGGDLGETWLPGPCDLGIRVGLRGLPQRALPILDSPVLLLQVKHQIIFTLVAVGLCEGVILPQVRAFLP